MADANERERDEEEANFRAGEVLGEDGADLRADRGAGVHDKGDEDIDIAFDGMAKGSVARGDDNFKQIRPDREMGWNAQNVNHHRHPDVAGAAAAKKAAKEPADEGDKQDDPERDGL